jgi:hypothetical protein
VIRHHVLHSSSSSICEIECEIINKPLNPEWGPFQGGP